MSYEFVNENAYVELLFETALEFTYKLGYEFKLRSNYFHDRNSRFVLDFQELNKKISFPTFYHDVLSFYSFFMDFFQIKSIVLA